MIFRKAQSGKILSAIPLIILIFIIMGLFIFLTSVLSGSAPGSLEADMTSLSEGVLFNSIDVILPPEKVESGVVIREKKILLIDAIVRRPLIEGRLDELNLLIRENYDSISRDPLFKERDILQNYWFSVRDSIKLMVEEDSKSVGGNGLCFVLYQGRGESVTSLGANMFYEYKNGVFVQRNDALARLVRYYDEGYLSKVPTFFVKDSNGRYPINIRHYYGECKDVF